MAEIIPTGKISAIDFYISSDSDNLINSSSAINTPEILKGQIPIEEGVSNLYLGTTDHAFNCQTCGHDKSLCPGHQGHYKLNYPIVQPAFITEVKKWLNLICFNCGQTYIKLKSMKNIPSKNILTELNKSKKDKDKSCYYCGQPHYHIYIDKDDSSSFWAVNRKLNNKEVKNVKKFGKRLLNTQIKMILNKIPDNVVIQLGKSPNVHPKHMISQYIVIPPTLIRADIKKIGGGRSSNDELTNQIQNIIKFDKALENVNFNNLDEKMIDHILLVQMAFHMYIKGKSSTTASKRSITTYGNSDIKSIYSSHTGKKGLIRKNILGRRSWFMARSVISGNPNLKPHQVELPLLIVRTIHIPESVQQFNFDKCQMYLNNARRVYPGCSGVLKISKGKEQQFSIDNLPQDFQLEIGDVILRDLMDGDYILFNRQPSLLNTSIGGHEVVVNTDPNILSIRMNVISCPPYNADFDGDAMNCIIPLSLSSRIEAKNISSINNSLISQKNSKPIMGQVQDSTIGCWKLSRDFTKIDKVHAVRMFKNLDLNINYREIPEISPGVYSGKDIISMAIPNINFTSKTSWYDENHAPYIKYNPNELKVKIDRGRLISGVLDKKSIGGGVEKGLYHIIESQYGSVVALECIFNMQQLAIEHTYCAGITISIGDLLISKESLEKIHKIESQTIQESELITDKLNNGEIIPPFGITVEQFYEQQQLGILHSTSLVDPIMRSIDAETNGLYQLVQTGSKGKWNNIAHISSSIGQKVISDARISEKFSERRSMVFFRRFDTSPESRGFIENSYITGLNSSEYAFDSMESRFSIINKALTTSVTGEQNRKSIKNLESIIINNLRQCVKAKNVIQFSYGEDNLDPRKTVKVQLRTIQLSDKELDAQYHYKSSSKSLQKYFDEEFEIIKRDRTAFREMYFRIEKLSINNPLIDEIHVAVDVNRVITDIKYNYIDVHMNEKSKRGIKLTAEQKKLIQNCENKPEIVLEMMRRVKKFCDLELPYVLTNYLQEQQQIPLPPHIIASQGMFRMLLRSELNSVRLSGINPTLLEFILEKIKIKYANGIIEYGTAVGIIAAQSISEPLTQYVLDSHHRAVGTGTSKSGISRYKEIMGAKTQEKTETPSMLLMVKEEFRENEAKVQEIANYIEMMDIKRFISKGQIFYERLGDPVHPDYRHEKKMISEYLKYAGPKIPGDLLNWCFRLEIDKTMMILKNMSLQTLVNALQKKLVFVVHNNENSDEIIVRIYLRNLLFETSNITLDLIVKEYNKLVSIVIRGINGILNTQVVSHINRTMIQPDGSIKLCKNIFSISTMGTNVIELMKNKYLEQETIQTDSIDEIYKVFGIEAARYKIIHEMRSLGLDVHYRHYTIYADEMTFTGKITSIEKAGLTIREPNNILLRIANTAPNKAIEDAAINGMRDNVTGISAPLVIGSVPKIGTMYNQLSIDEDMIKEHFKKNTDVFDDL